MPTLLIRKSPVFLAVSRFELKEGENRLGRDTAADIRVPDSRISSRHVLFTVTGGAVECTDLGSRNGTYVDGARISGTCRLLPGQSIQAGNTELVLEGDAGEVDAEWQGTLVSTTLAGAARRDESVNILSARGINDEEALAGLSDQERVRKLTQRMKLIEKGIRVLHGAATPAELLDRAMGLVFETLHTDTGCILILDPQNGAVFADYAAYIHGEKSATITEKVYSRSLVERVLQNRAGLLFDLDRTPHDDSSRSIYGLKIQTAICCPIHSEGRIYGVLYLDSKAAGSKFTSDDLDLTMNLAGITGVALENFRLTQKLETQARIRDNLKRFVSANIAEQIIAEDGKGSFHLQSQKAPVTVLFADIRGFTPLSETLAPLEVARLLNTYFSAMSEIVFRHGGTLDKFIGDRIMVLFNAPFAVTAPEITAVRAALDMRARLREMLPGWMRNGIPRFDVGIGINSGEGVVGSIGTAERMEYTAIGDCVNVASRVCDIAKPDQILITPSVADRLNGQIPVRALGSVKLKGKAAEVPVLEVLEADGEKKPE